MAIDLQKMRAKLAALSGGNSKSKSSFWRPQDGEQQIRIVSTPDGDPFKNYHFHYNLGNNAGFLCPKKNFGDDCPVCSFASSLYSEGSDESKNMAKSLFPRMRFFSPVLVRGEEDLGVRAWGYGKMAYESLLNLVLNPEYGDITDPLEGTDLKLTYGKPPGASYPQTSFMPARKTSKLCSDMTDEQCQDLVDTTPDFNTLFDRKSTADVQAMLDSYLSDDATSEAASTETHKYNNNSTPASNTSASNSVEDAFSELLGS